MGLLVDFPENLWYILIRQDTSVRDSAFKILKPKYAISVIRFNLLAAGIIFLILAHPVYKM